MQARGLVQIALPAAVSAGKAGRERGPSQTPPAFAVIHSEQEASAKLRAAWGWSRGDHGFRLLGQDSRASSVRMIVRRLPTGGPWFDSQKFTRRFRSAEVDHKDGTTANERLRTMTSADAAKRLGPLIRNQMTTMGLDNLPKRCGCPSIRTHPKLPNKGKTHNLANQPCPFETGNFPQGVCGTCCSLRGESVAAYELETLGETDLSERMYQDMTVEEAKDFLRSASSCSQPTEERACGPKQQTQAAGLERRLERRDWESGVPTTLQISRRRLSKSVKPRVGTRPLPVWGTE
jgi:hypothetical protein